ncbi:MAG TPA: glycosyl hydrolase, partial [Blastocatellia bacterium]|nr:glycosyl hydrolase [Blastocatellia bacterium]
AAEAKLLDDATSIEKRNNEILRALRGDTALRQRQEILPPSIVERVNTIVSDQRMSTSAPTQTQKDHYAVAAQEFEQVLGRLRPLIEGDLARLEKAMEAAGAPWTPGRIPEWKDK